MPPCSSSPRAIPGSRTCLQRQEQAIDGATHLLNALLDLGRLESGAIEPNLTAVPLTEVFGELRREIEVAAAAKHLSLEFFRRSPDAVDRSGASHAAAAESHRQTR